MGDKMEGAFPEEDGGGKKDIRDIGMRWMPQPSNVALSKGRGCSPSSSEASEVDGVESSTRGAALSFISWINSRALEDLSTGIYKTFRRWIESLAHKWLALRRSAKLMSYLSETPGRESLGITYLKEMRYK